MQTVAALIAAVGVVGAAEMGDAVGVVALEPCVEVDASKSPREFGKIGFAVDAA